MCVLYIYIHVHIYIYNIHIYIYTVYHLWEQYLPNGRKLQRLIRKPCTRSNQG